MKAYPYNKVSNDGRRLYALMRSEFNEGHLNENGKIDKLFDKKTVKATAQCRTNQLFLLIPSNMAGVRRPAFQVHADIEHAWGDFTDKVSTLDFTHGGHELPLSYVQTLDDETIKKLIDAGMYNDENFEPLMSKLMRDEAFDLNIDMSYFHLDLEPREDIEGFKKSTPVIFVEPIASMDISNTHSESENSLISLIQRAADIAIELKKEGIKTSDFVQKSVVKDNELFVDEFEDLLEKEQDNMIPKDKIDRQVEDAEVDVTHKLKGALDLGASQDALLSEDERIQAIKEKELRDENERRQSIQAQDAEFKIDPNRYNDEELEL